MGNCLGISASKICGKSSDASNRQLRPPQNIQQAMISSEKASYRSGVPVAKVSASTDSSGAIMGDAGAHWMLLAVLAWVLLQIAEQFFLPAMSSKFWSFLCFLLFFVSRRAPIDDGVASVAPQGVAPSVTVDESPETDEALRQFLAELRSRKGDVPPREGGSENSKGWIDASKPSVRLFVKMASDPYRLLIDLRLKISDQVASLPIVESHGDSLLGGIVPIFCAPMLWPTWFPFCESATLLRHIALGQEIWHVKFRCAFVTADAIIYLGLVNDMASAGRIECVIGGPDDGGRDGQSWLGIQVPKQTTQLRVPVRSCRIILTPTSATDGIAQMHVEMIDMLRIRWIHLLFWRTLSTWVLPLVAKVHSKFSGSAYDQHYNGGAGQSRADETPFLVEISQQIAARFPALS